MINRDKLEKLMKEYAYKISVNQELFEKFLNECNNKYDLPPNLVSDYISLRKPFQEANQFELFGMYDIMISVDKPNKVNNFARLFNYYSEMEVNKFSKLKFEEEKLKFPLVIKAIQVNDDQWIGRISAKTLMLMRKAQVINYEENTQRVKRKVVKGDNTFFEISLKQKTVKEISAKLSDNTYISDDLTLNIPYDSNADFHYDANKMELVIKSIDAFDMIDGYHRYISLCRSSDANEDFDYNMELRVTNFDETKCQRFIYQKDQKTKMSKLDSDTFNPESLANMVVARLNENPSSNIKGMINRSDGLISFGEIAAVINYYFFKIKPPKNEERKLVIKVSSELIECFNIITEHDINFLESPHLFQEIVVLCHVFKSFYENDKSGLIDKVDYVLSKMTEMDSSKFIKNKTMRKALENEVERFM